MTRNGNRKGDAVLLVALAGGKSVKDSAELAGVGERTAHRRLSDAEFRDEIRRLRRQMLERSAARVADAGVKAAETLLGLLGSEREQVQLQAARILLDKAIKLRQAEIAAERNTLTWEQAALMCGRIIEIVNRHTDKDTRVAIGTEMRGLLNELRASSV